MLLFSVVSEFGAVFLSPAPDYLYHPAGLAVGIRR